MPEGTIMTDWVQYLREILWAAYLRDCAKYGRVVKYDTAHLLAISSVRDLTAIADELVGEG